jgi:hypothetical protein
MTLGIAVIVEVTSCSLVEMAAVFIFQRYKKLSAGVLNEALCHEDVQAGGYTVSKTLRLDGGKCSASRPGCSTPREFPLDIHWMGGWKGPRAL